MEVSATQKGRKCCTGAYGIELENVSREDSDPHPGHNMLVHGWPAEAGHQPLVSDAMEHARRSTVGIRAK